MFRLKFYGKSCQGVVRTLTTTMFTRTNVDRRRRETLSSRPPTPLHQPFSSVFVGPLRDYRVSRIGGLRRCTAVPEGLRRNPLSDQYQEKDVPLNRRLVISDECSRRTSRMEPPLSDRLEGFYTRSSTFTTETF